MRLLTFGILLGLAIGCGNEKKDKTRETLPEAISTPDAISIPPSTDTKISLNPNEVPPELVEVVQTKLGEIRYSFSKPIESIRNKNFDSSLIHQSWADSRQTYILTFDHAKVEEKSFKTIILSGLIGEFGRINNQEIKFDIDNNAPEIKEVEILSGNSIKVTFTEKVDLTKSKFNLNNEAAGDLISAEGPFATIRFNSINLTGDVSYKLSISNVSDVLGNSIEKSSKIFTKILDTQAPKIKSIKQLEWRSSPSSPTLKFEIEFNEYTQDTRDFDTNEPGSTTPHDYSISFKINGKDIGSKEASWTLRADHLGGFLFIGNSPTIFTDGEENSFEFILTDSSGNSGPSTFSSIVQSKAPHLVNIEGIRPCKVTDSKTLQCAVSSPEAVSGTLSPYSTWVSEKYQVTSVIDLENSENPYRLEFKFPGDIPERYIGGVEVIDVFKNYTEYELSEFIPYSKVPQVTEVLVASPRAIEIQFDVQIKSIGEVIVDGRSVAFTTFGSIPSGLGLNTSLTILNLAETLSPGPHRVELKEVRAVRYDFSPFGKISIEVNVNKDAKILASSLNSMRNLPTENDYFFETTDLIKKDDFELFQSGKIDQSISQIPIKEFELELVEKLENSYLYRLVKGSSEGLKPDPVYSADLTFKLRGQREIGPIRANWVKIEPALIP